MIWTDRQLPPTDPDSDALVRLLAGMARNPRSPANFGPLDQGYPVYEVNDSTPRVRVQLETQAKHQPPTGKAAPYQAQLQALIDFAGVPIPDYAVPGANVDHALVIRQGDYLWELWRVRRDNTGQWFAQWGGATDHYSTSTGAFDADSWLPYSRTPIPQWRWGVRASGLMILPGLARGADATFGRFGHALTLILPRIRSDKWAWPAQRTDGDVFGENAIPYGAHFVLDPSFDVTTLKPSTTQMFARAAQEYGLIVGDQDISSVTFAADLSPLWLPTLGNAGARYKMMAAFPWERLMLRPMDLRATSGP